PARRAAAAGVAGPPLVPRRLRPHPARLAQLPGRPDRRTPPDRRPLPAAHAARGGRRRVRAGVHRPGPRLGRGGADLRPRRSDRHVEPLRLVSLGRRWYLVAYDVTRHDWRSFRVDRIDAPRRTGARFLPRTLPAADAAEFVRASTDQALGWDVEVLISAPAD